LNIGPWHNYEPNNSTFADKAALKRLIERSRPLPNGYWDAWFAELADEWHEDTDLLSSPLQKALHPAYLKIINLGASTVPFILRDLSRRGGQWYIALAAITGEQPETTSATPTTQEFKNAWLEWGRDRHIV
jgi:hypothetical protein